MGVTEPAAARAVVLQGNRFLRSGHLFWFFAAGILSTLVDVGLLYLLTEHFGIWYLSSAATSYCCGIFVSFCLNKYITFHDTTTNPFRQFPLFAAVSVSGFMLNLAVLFLLVDVFSFHYLTGKFGAICISFFWNYFGQSRLTFRV